MRNREHEMLTEERMEERLESSMPNAETTAAMNGPDAYDLTKIENATTETLDL